MPIEIIEFRKRPILKIIHADNDKIKIQFGIKKALLIKDNYEAIIKFIEDNDKLSGAKTNGLLL